MCMFQEVFVKPTSDVRCGFKVVQTKNWCTYRTCFRGPYQHTSYRPGKWQRGRKPGFNVFARRHDAEIMRENFGTGAAVIPVKVRRVVSRTRTYSKEPGYCALEMFITKADARKAGWRPRAATKKKKKARHA